MLFKYTALVCCRCYDAAAVGLTAFVVVVVVVVIVIVVFVVIVVGHRRCCSSQSHDILQALTLIMSDFYSSRLDAVAAVTATVCLCVCHLFVCLFGCSCAVVVIKDAVAAVTATVCLFVWL